MDAIITGEGNGIVGLSVIDRNEIEHLIELNESGTITGHETERYPNSGRDRTKEESEHINQARRLAKWHVYRERGYDTLTPYDNPDRLAAAIMAILDAPEVKLEHYFGELEAQLLRHQNGTTDHVPFDISGSSDIVVYRQDIWIQPDPTDAEPPLLDQFCQYVNAPLDTLGGILGDGPDPRDSMPSYEIEAVSDIYYLHNDTRTTEEYPTEKPLDREPDARIELLAIDPTAFDSFRQLLASHLGNQIRDCFLDMGLEPPEPFQTPGLGKHNSMIKQQLMPMYDKHFLAGDDSEWGRETTKPWS